MDYDFTRCADWKICAGLLIVTGLVGAGLSYQVYGMGDVVPADGCMWRRTWNPGMAVPSDNG